MEYLAFADKIEENTYSLYFTTDTDTVWGDQWNVCPSGIIPNIKVDPNCVSSSFLFDSEEELYIAGENTCFSMQDCIDQIIPMIWSDTSSKIGFYSHFGEDKDKVLEKLEKASLTPYMFSNYEDKASDILDSMMDDLDNIRKNEDEDNNDDLEF